MQEQQALYQRLRGAEAQLQQVQAAALTEPASSVAEERDKIEVLSLYAQSLSDGLRPDSGASQSNGPG